MSDRKKELVVALLWVRRAARALEESCEVFRSSARWHERLAKILEEESPFNAHRAKVARATAETHRADMDRLLPGQHGRLGCLLRDIAMGLDPLTTLDERCDLLNVNQADRRGLTNEDGIYSIAFVHGLEDSAMHRNEDRKSSPLFLVANAAMMEWQLNTPEGRACMDKMTEELFSPGGLFYGATMYRQAPDGTMVPQPHDLTVHDETGSRVIKRGPTLH